MRSDARAEFRQNLVKLVKNWSRIGQVGQKLVKLVKK